MLYACAAAQRHLPAKRRTAVLNWRQNNFTCLGTVEFKFFYKLSTGLRVKLEMFILVKYGSEYHHGIDIECRSTRDKVDLVT